MENLIVLVSGGRSSAMMARHIQTSYKYNNYNRVYVFCNTGLERPETIDFLKNMVNYWNLDLICVEGVYCEEPNIGVKHRVVSIENLDMTGKIFTGAIKQMNKYKDIGVPNQAVPYCSDYLKTRVSHDFCRHFFNGEKYIKAIGYRLEDIPRRVTINEIIKDVNRIAPLLTDFERPVSKFDLTEFFNLQQFKLMINSTLGNCEMCWKKSDKLLLENIKYGTRFISWYNNLELKYKDHFFRGNKSINDLVNLSGSSNQLQLFNEDFEDNCVCSF